MKANILRSPAALLFWPRVRIAQQPAPPPDRPTNLGSNVLIFHRRRRFLGCLRRKHQPREHGPLSHEPGARRRRDAGVKDSPAEKAGLRKDDVILRIDGENVSSVRKLNRLVSEMAPDQR
jgi:membrane-associated protease RseP (regulator of RpoE activity)